MPFYLAPVVSKTSASVALAVKGVTSQTADLLQIQDSNSNNLVSVDVNGIIYGGFGADRTSGTLDWNDSTNARPGTGVTLLTGNATNGPGTSQYFHSFSFEYATKTGAGQLTQLAIPYGNGPGAGMYIRGRYTGTWSAWCKILQEQTNGYVAAGQHTALAKFHAISEAAGDITMIAQGAASQTADLQQWQNSAGAIQAQVTSGGDIVASRFGAATATNSYLGGASTANTTLTVNSGGAARVPIIAKGFASQSANLQEWQDSASAIVTSVSSAGTVTTTGFFQGVNNYIGWNGGPTNALQARGSVGNVTLQIKAQSSQTGNLTEWQDSAGNPVGCVYINGQMAAGVPFLVSSFAPMLAVQNQNASRIGVVVRGHSTQTASVQEWQTSAGAVLASISGVGSLTIGSTGNIVTPILRVTGASPGNSRIGAAVADAAAELTITPQAASTKPLVVRGAASQSANLQEWQDDTGGVVASVGSDGGITTISAKIDEVDGSPGWEMQADVNGSLLFAYRG